MSIRAETEIIPRMARPPNEPQGMRENLKVFGFLLAVLVAVTGIAFAAGNYPTRAEWEASNLRQLESIEKLKTTVGTMQLEQVHLKDAIDSIKESQARSEGTQNEIRQALGELQTPRKRRRR